MCQSTLIGMADGRRADQRLQAAVRHELGGGLLGQTQRVVAGGRARGRVPIGAGGPGHAAVDEEQPRARAHLERQAAGLRLSCRGERRRCPDVDDDDAAFACSSRA